MWKPGRPVHPSNGTGTAPDAATSPAGVEITFVQGANLNNQTTSTIAITNREAVGGNFLEVSFNNGRYWFAMPPSTTTQLAISSRWCRLRGYAGATADYSIMGIIS